MVHVQHNVNSIGMQNKMTRYIVRNNSLDRDIRKFALSLYLDHIHYHKVHKMDLNACLSKLTNI